MTLPVYIEAEYESGYVHREDENDHSPYVRGKNIFDDLVHKRPESVHGKMVRFSLITNNGEEITRYDIDWTPLPDNARPIRFKHMEGDFLDGGLVESRLMGIDFGFQYTDENGRNVQEVMAIP